MFFAIAAALLITSCSSYIDSYEDICADAKERVEAASSAKELGRVMKEFRAEIRELNEEYPEEYELYKAPNNDDEAVQELYSRRMKAFNAVNGSAALKVRELASGGK